MALWIDDTHDALVVVYSWYIPQSVESSGARPQNNTDLADHTKEDSSQWQPMKNVRMHAWLELLHHLADFPLDHFL